MGTATYLSDANGNPYQFFLNLPFGEAMAEQRTGAFENQYKFKDYGIFSFKKAKDEHTAQSAELDQKTGFYYYGARYYNPQISNWLSIDPLAEQFPSWSPYNFKMNNPIRLVDPDGRAPVDILGVTKDDAKKFKAVVHTVLADSKFDNLKGLIDLKGKKFRKIESGDLATALDGVSLSADEQAYVDVLVNTINSDDKHMVEYLSSSDNASSKGATAVKNHLNKEVGAGIGDGMLTPEGNLKAGTISVLGGEGFNVPTNNGSHSFIIGVSGDERAVTSGHEVFGHGIPSASGATPATNNANAIRADNLVRRLLGLPQRDGSKHGGYDQGHIKDPYRLPKTQ